MQTPFPEAELYELAARRPENELLLVCARKGAGGGTAERAGELARRVSDWDYLYRLSRLHSVHPLLYRGIEGTAAAVAAPPSFREKLRGDFRENAARNLLLAGELVRISKLFESAGVPLLAYKGPALAVQAYGDLSLRRFVDLDVIVRPRDVARAGELLLSLGFRKPVGIGEAQEKFLVRRQHNLAFSRDSGRLIVELHWGVSPEPFASLPLGEDVWERASPFKLFGAEVKTLSPEDLLLALSVHGTKHLWERLAWVCDVAAVINSRPDLNWSYVVGRARESRVERMLYLVLRLARGLFGVRLPDGVVGAAGDKVVAGLASEVVSALFRGAEYEPAGFVRSLRFNTRARRRLGDKLGYVRYVLTPTDGDLSAVSLPAGISFLYYLLRPLRLALKGGSGH